MENSQDNPIGSFFLPFYRHVTLSYLLSLICIPGIVGNGIVIIFLGFYIKRNPFTVYILNLSVADSGTLIFLFVTGILIPTRHFPSEITECLLFTYCTGQFLLTIISIDRCLALFFPIWHRCHRPPYLSTILCAFSWIVSSLLCVIHYVIHYASYRGEWYGTIPSFTHIFICTSVCVPLMVASSLALFVKGYLKSQMKRTGKLLKAIMLALFFFLIFSIPPSAIYLNDALFTYRYDKLITYGYLCACLNSSVNPVIYFLLGRKKEHKICNLKVNLQRLFKEEEESEEQPETQVDTQV